jgi:hypothetical protein
MAARLPGKRSASAVALSAAALVLAGCGSAASPETEVRAVIEAGETAAEARDLSGLMELVSSRYEDDEGRDRDELKYQLRAWLIANQSIGLVTRVDSIEFPYRDMARVELTVGSLARDAGEGSPLDLAAEVQRITLELQLEDGDWKAIRARRSDTD